MVFRNPLKTKGLFKYTVAIEGIKVLWNGGERNMSEIGRQIGYKARQTIDQINKMLEKGELPK